MKFDVNEKQVFTIFGEFSEEEFERLLKDLDDVMEAAKMFPDMLTSLYNSLVEVAPWLGGPVL